MYVLYTSCTFSFVYVSLVWCENKYMMSIVMVGNRERDEEVERGYEEEKLDEV